MNGVIKMPTTAEKRRFREQYNIPNQNSSRAVRRLGFNSMAEFYRNAQREEAIQQFQQNRAVRRIQQGRQTQREIRAIDDARNARRQRRTEASVEYENGRYAPAGVRQWNLDYAQYSNPTDGGETITIQSYWYRFWLFRVQPLLASIQRIFRDTQGEGRIGISVYGTESDDSGVIGERKYSYQVRKITDIAGLEKEWLKVYGNLHLKELKLITSLY